MPVDFYAADLTGTYVIDGVTGDQIMQFNVIPEPSSLMLTALGLVSLAGYGWRRRRTAGRRKAAPPL